MIEYDKIVISLTTIKGRENYLEKTLGSLYRQKTNFKFIIHIYVSTEPYLIDEGFTLNEINILKKKFYFCEFSIVKNIGSLRKIIPALKMYDNIIIVTVDDDCIYEKNMLQNLLNSFKENQCCICSRSRNFVNTISYKLCAKQVNKKKDMNLLPEGVGGILYHSSFFTKEFINYDFDLLKHSKYKDMLKHDDLIIRGETYLNKIYVSVNPHYYNYNDLKPSKGLTNNFNQNSIFLFTDCIEMIKYIRS